jgi:exonuclease I
MGRTECRGCGDPIWWSSTETRNRPIMLDVAPHPDGNAVLVRTAKGYRTRLLSHSQAAESSVTIPRYRVHASRCPALRAEVA